MTNLHAVMPYAPSTLAPRWPQKMRILIETAAACMVIIKIMRQEKSLDEHRMLCSVFCELQITTQQTKR